MRTIIILITLLLASCHTHRQTAEQTYTDTATEEHTDLTATHSEDTHFRLHRLDSLLTTLHIDSLVLTVGPVLPDSLPGTLTTLRLYGLDSTGRRHSERDDTAAIRKDDSNTASIDRNEQSHKSAARTTEAKTRTASPWPPLLAMLLILAAAGYVLYRSGKS